MDFKKIFLKDACPTSIGGQAVMEGIMMKGLERTSVVLRLPNGKLHIRTKANPKKNRIAKVPIIRGVFAFFDSIVEGTKILMYSADVLEAASEEEEARKLAEEAENSQQNEAYKGEKKKGAIESFLEKFFGERAVWNIMLYFSVIVSLIVGIGIFILLPTVVVDLFGSLRNNPILLNLLEGVIRIGLFVLYVMAIRRVQDIKRLFMYHGAEHKTIHCFEKGLELTPENAQSFYTLHPRCGTSFLMFVMVIGLVLFSFVGWPNPLVRLLSRLLLLPVIAGLSYELLKWAGRSDGILVKVLSIPGLYLQKLTTCEPDEDQLEVAIAAVKAVLVKPDTPQFEGSYDDYLTEIVNREDFESVN